MQNSYNDSTATLPHGLGQILLTDNLREWIEKELTMENNSQILEAVKDKIKRLIRITRDGNMKVVAAVSDKDTCYLYFVARAFSLIAEYVKSDEVKNEDLKTALKINPPSIDNYVMEMRKEGLIEQVRTGVHRINYLRMPEALDDVLSKIG